MSDRPVLANIDQKERMAAEPIAGAVYQFNRAKAEVLCVKNGWLIWADHGVRSHPQRRVPVWYFKKYSTPTK